MDELVATLAIVTLLPAADAGMAGVIYILYRREFRSEMLEVPQNDSGALPG